MLETDFMKFWRSLNNELKSLGNTGCGPKIAYDYYDKWFASNADRDLYIRAIANSIVMERSKHS